MDPITVSALVGRPREEVFEYLADVANHLEFSDHFVTDYRLTREDSFGLGAGARFRLGLPFNRFDFADVTLSDLDAPWRLVLRGRTGKYNRVRLVSVYELEPGAGGGTRVTLTTETEPKLASDRIVEALGQRRYLRRHHKRALKRLRSILEDGEGRGQRATIAGGPRKPASQFSL
jgi:uncharacterized protein YndB with AHSA1/START domain